MLITPDGIKLDKSETMIVYVYEKGILIEKSEIKVNVNNNLCINKVK